MYGATRDMAAMPLVCALGTRRPLGTQLQPAVWPLLQPCSSTCQFPLNTDYNAGGRCLLKCN